MNLSLTTVWKFRQGDQVKDVITEFKGVVTSRIEYLNGCRQYCVEPKLDKEGKLQKHQYVDEGQLVLIPKRKKRATGKDREKPPGGVMPNEPE